MVTYAVRLDSFTCSLHSMPFVFLKRGMLHMVLLKTFNGQSQFKLMMIYMYSSRSVQF